MTFLTPIRLWALVAVAILAVIYVLMQRRRGQYALRFAAGDLLDAVAPDRPGMRRHAPALLFLTALTTMVLAFAQPARQVEVPVERATVVIAIDVSLSMQANDVTPSRLEAAQEAAIGFIDELPPTLNVGIVSFAGTASVLVTPTQDRTPAINAIENLTLAESTAIGEAIFTSLGALENAPGADSPEPPPARVVLLSDGETTVGRQDSEGIAAAIDAGVPVSTIAFGTPGGVIFYDDPNTPQIESDMVEVPVREQNLRAIAAETDGAFFTATSLAELDAVYDDIGSAIGFETVDREITDWFVGGSLLLLMLTAATSLVWFSRLP